MINLREILLDLQFDFHESKVLTQWSMLVDEIGSIMCPNMLFIVQDYKEY